MFCDAILITSSFPEANATEQVKYARSEYDATINP